MLSILHRSIKRAYANPGAESQFVTLVAIVVLSIAIPASLLGILQHLLLWFVYPPAPPIGPGDLEGFPAVARWVLPHFGLFVSAMALVSLVTVISAIGLLRRKNWARQLFTVILSVGIGWSVVVAVFLRPSLDEMARRPSGDLDVAGTAVWVAMIVGALAMAALCGWIIKRLSSPAIRAEFS